MIRSGIVPIDELCDGLRPRSTYLLTGGAGAGKTTCSLQFVNQGLRSGETVLLVTHSAREDLLASSERLGIGLRDALRAEQAVVLRYRSDFGRRLARAGTAERVFEELRELLLEYRPRRVAIDTFAPLLDDGSPSPMPAASLAELLERSQALALLTYPDDLSAGYDRKAEPLVQSAAGVFRLTRDALGTRRVQIVSLRHFDTSATKGSALSEATPLALAAESLIDETGPLRLIHVIDAPTDDLLVTLRLQHEVTVRVADDDAPTEGGIAALIVEADHTTLDRARRLVRSHAVGATPIVVISRFNLRSLDRARLLRDGADEVLAGDMGAPELLQRLATALRRGHLSRPPAAVHEDESLTQSTLAAPGQALDRERFTAALQSRSAHDDAVPFTVVRLTTQDTGAAERRAIVALILGNVRLASGDLVAMLDDGVAVYLHGAGKRDVAPFLDRLRARRPAGAPTLRVETASFPNDGAAVRQLVEPLEVR